MFLKLASVVGGTEIVRSSNLVQAGVNVIGIES